MEDFTINGRSNQVSAQAINGLLYKPVYRLSDSELSVIDSDYATCIFQALPGSNPGLWVSDYDIKETATLYGCVDTPVLELQFMLGDSMEHNLAGLGIRNAPSSSVNLYYQSCAENRVTLRKGSRVITFDVHLSPADIEESCSILPALAPFMKQIEKGKSASLSDQAIIASPELLLNIKSILHTPSRPELQNKIIQPQIDSLLFGTLCNLTQSQRAAIKTNDKDHKAVKEVWNYLKNDLDSPLTIKQLSKIFLINRQKLKILFKEKYGVPILQFTINERISKACLLLQKTDASIQDIAFTVGYKTAGAFAEKFKQVILLSPQQYRSKMRQKG